MEVLLYETSARFCSQFFPNYFSGAILKYSSQERYKLYGRLQSSHPNKSIIYKSFLKDVQSTFFCLCLPCTNASSCKVARNCVLPVKV